MVTNDGRSIGQLLSDRSVIRTMPVVRELSVQPLPDIQECLGSQLDRERDTYQKI